MNQIKFSSGSPFQILNSKHNITYIDQLLKKTIHLLGSKIYSAQLADSLLTNMEAYPISQWLINVEIVFLNSLSAWQAL